MSDLMKRSIVIFIFISNYKDINGFDVDFNNLENILSEEETLLQSFDKYLLSEENRISRLRQMYEHFRQQNSIAMKDKNLFLSHPNDVYLLIKRIRIEWKTAEELLEPNKQIVNNFLHDKHTILKVLPHFSDAVEGYQNIVFVYELDMNSAVNGLINYKTYSSGEQTVFKSLSNQTLNAFDCYSFGKLSFDYEDYSSAQKWLSIALNLTDNETSDQLKGDIIQYLSVSEYYLKNFNKVIELLNQRTSLFPQKQLDTIFLDIMNKNMSMILDENYNNWLNTPQEDVGPDNIFIRSLEEENDVDHCIGRRGLNDSIKSELKCFYLNSTFKSYLRLFGIKVEELYKRPQIVLIHNFLSEEEIHHLKNVSIPRLIRAKVLHSPGNVLHYSKEKIGSVYHIEEKSSKVIEIISRRISDVTGFQTENEYSELIQFAKYNVGGRFWTHYDSDSYDEDPDHVKRILNMLVYLNEVGGGGHTVFPKLNLRVAPEKSSAILWFNLMNSGDLDEHSLHAGCPVLYGQKWTIIKHISILGQTAKCSLNRYDYNSIIN